MKAVATVVSAAALVVVVAVLVVIALSGQRSVKAAEENACWAEVTARIQAHKAVSDRVDALRLLQVETRLDEEQLVGILEAIAESVAEAEQWIEGCEALQ